MDPVTKKGCHASRRLTTFSLLVSLLWTYSLFCNPERTPACARLGFQSADLLPQSVANTEAESELLTGIALTRKGEFDSAIPHLLAARGRVIDEYAANFDLALCYAGTSRYAEAIGILAFLKNGGHSTEDVNNLLAQAYIGAAQPGNAFTAFQQAVQQTPLDEKLYLLVADACMDHESYDLGVEVLDIGLQHLPHSARLHYERGVFFTFQDQPDLARSDYEVATKLAPGTDISYMALGQDNLLQGNIQGAINLTRQAIRSGHENYILLTIFGDAVVRAGTPPDQPLFAEAQAALEKSIAEHPHYAVSQLDLGELFLGAGRLDDAIAHLEEARQLAPTNTAVYSHLAIAYRREGHVDEEQRMLAILSELNQEQAQKYKTDSPSKPGYVASGRAIRKPSQ
jgi:Flp pilus assembly protein TadD